MSLIHDRAPWFTIGVVLSLMAGSAAAVDVAAGMRRATVCFSCHGENGQAVVVGTPHLAGQDRRYLEKALRDYRSGERSDPTMAAMAKPLSEADIANIAAYFHLTQGRSQGQSVAENLATLQRIAPVATVYVANASDATMVTTAAPVVASAPGAPEVVYKQFCAACHDAGVAGAPRLGDKAAWAPRLQQGRATLQQHVIEGLKVMPPKGGCGNCSENELRSTADYMIDQGS